MTTENKKVDARRFEVGNVVATVFKNVAPNGRIWFNTSIQSWYYSKTTSQKVFGNNFRQSDFADVTIALQRASNYIDNPSSFDTAVPEQDSEYVQHVMNQIDDTRAAA